MAVKVCSLRELPRHSKLVRFQIFRYRFPRVITRLSGVVKFRGYVRVQIFVCPGNCCCSWRCNCVKVVEIGRGRFSNMPHLRAMKLVMKMYVFFILLYERFDVYSGCRSYLWVVSTHNYYVTKTNTFKFTGVIVAETAYKIFL